MTRVETVCVIPALNAAISIGEIVALTKCYIDHVIVVDDGSTDSTASIAFLKGAEVILHEGTKGKGAALRVGFRRALCYNPLIVTTIDADGENDPTDLPMLVYSLLTNNVEIVIGNRTVSHSSLLLGFKLTRSFLEYHYGIPIDDPMSGIRAYRSNALKKLLPALEADEYDIDLEIVFNIITRKLCFGEVPVSGNSVQMHNGFKTSHIEAFIRNLQRFGPRMNSATAPIISMLSDCVRMRKEFQVQLKHTTKVFSYNSITCLYE